MLGFLSTFHVIIRRGVRLRPFTASCPRGAAPLNFSHHLNILYSTLSIKYIELFINIWNRVSEARASAEGLICSSRISVARVCPVPPRMRTFGLSEVLLLAAGDRRIDSKRRARERERDRDGERGSGAYAQSIIVYRGGGTGRNIRGIVVLLWCTSKSECVCVCVRERERERW